MLHQKVDRITALSAGKAMANLFRWRHHKRRCLIVVEGTQSLIVNSRFAQANKLAHHIHNIGGVHDFVYRRSVYHNLQNAKLRIKQRSTKQNPTFFNAAHGLRGTRAHFGQGFLFKDYYFWPKAIFH